MSKEPIMKKLEKIPKRNIYEVPEGYFDKLPGIIQARVANENPKQAFVFTWVSGLKYALPAILIGVAVFFWYNQNTQQDESAQSMLASIETEDLISYINESDISTEELLDALSFDLQDIADIEDEVYGELYDQELDALADEFDIDLNNL